MTQLFRTKRVFDRFFFLPNSCNQLGWAISTHFTAADVVLQPSYSWIHDKALLPVFRYVLVTSASGASSTDLSGPSSTLRAVWCVERARPFSKRFPFFRFSNAYFFLYVGHAFLFSKLFRFYVSQMFCLFFCFFVNVSCFVLFFVLLRFSECERPVPRAFFHVRVSSPRNKQLIVFFFFRFLPLCFVFFRSTWTGSCTRRKSSPPSTCCPRCRGWWSRPSERAWPAKTTGTFPTSCTRCTLR